MQSSNQCYQQWTRHFWVNDKVKTTALLLRASLTWQGTKGSKVFLAAYINPVWLPVQICDQQCQRLQSLRRTAVSRRCFHIYSEGSFFIQLHFILHLFLNVCS